MEKIYCKECKYLIFRRFGRRSYYQCTYGAKEITTVRNSPFREHTWTRTKYREESILELNGNNDCSDYQPKLKTGILNFIRRLI